MKNYRTENWKEGLYLEGRDYGHEYVENNPDAPEIEIESAIYNYLMEYEPSLRRYIDLAEGLAAKAARRVIEVRKNRVSG